MRALWGMVVKEFHQVGRDTRALGILLVLPTALLVFLGYVISMDVEHVTVALLDDDRTETSRRFVSHLTGYDQFDLVLVVDRPDDLEEAVFDGEARVGLHVPRGFEEGIERGEQVAVQALVDGTNSLTASSAIGTLRSFVHAFNTQVAAERLTTAGRASPVGLAVPRMRMYYNPELRSSFHLIPGLVAFILALANALATALSIVREKEQGTIEQIRLSPLPSWTFIVGKTIPYVVISIVSTVLILAAGHFLFGLPMRGNPWMLVVSTLVFIVCTLALGLLISSITDSQQVAFTVSAIATMLPTFVLSGFVFPIRNMPLLIRIVTYVVPARYYVRILRGTLLQDADWTVLAPELGMLAALTVVLMLVATIRIRRGGLG